MKVLGIIPARLNSTRLPKKLLINVAGKPVLQWTWEAVRRSRVLDEIIIAADSREIMDAAKRFGAQTMLTSPVHNSGTERVREGALKIKPDIAVNIQADEPLINAQIIDSLALFMLDNPDAEVATVIKKISIREEAANPDVVKVVVDKDGFALYFSRLPIPFVRGKKNSQGVFYKHLGVYAYRLSFLEEFGSLPKSYLEDAEKLEQLRFLYAGKKIKTIITEVETVGIDTDEDIKKFENILNSAANKS